MGGGRGRALVWWVGGCGLWGVVGAGRGVAGGVVFVVGRKRAYEITVGVGFRGVLFRSRAGDGG